MFLDNKNGVFIMEDKRKTTSSDIVQRNHEELANGYPKWFRFIEYLGLILFFTFSCIIIWKIIFSFTDLMTTFRRNLCSNTYWATQWAAVRI